MKIEVRYFASLREALGPRETVELPSGATLRTLRDQLIATDGRHAEVLDRRRAVRCALDQAMADESAPIGEGAEVAFFPPVTGG
jgi:molybdopterin synthase sulfur carrier subunit